MSASSAIAHAPIDQLVAYRAAGEVIPGGSDEALVTPGNVTNDYPYWGIPVR